MTELSPTGWALPAAASAARPARGSRQIDAIPPAPSARVLSFH